MVKNLYIKRSKWVKFWKFLRGIVKLDSSILKGKIEMIKLEQEKEYQPECQDQDLIDSCQIFILNFCEEIAIKFQTQIQILNRKKK